MKKKYIILFLVVSLLGFGAFCTKTREEKKETAQFESGRPKGSGESAERRRRRGQQPQVAETEHRAWGPDDVVDLSKEEEKAVEIETIKASLKPIRSHLTAMGKVLAQLNSVQEQTNVELKVANALWVQKGYQFQDEFIRIVRESYQAEFTQVDFAAASEAARQSINTWVEQQTDQKIKDL